MSNFYNRINELIKTPKDIEKVMKFLGLKNNSNIYEWLDGNTKPRIPTLIKLSNFFECSLDYLLGLTDNDEKVFNDSIPPFKNQFKLVLDNSKVKQKDILNDKILSNGHLDKIRKNKYLLADNMIKLADYLKVSVDELVGRV